MTERTTDSPYVCGWSFDDACAAKLAAAFDDDTPDSTKPAQAQIAVNQAGEVLYALSGRQFGDCEVTVRPCRSTCYSSSGWGTGLRWTPVIRGGQWLNISCGICTGSCSCTTVCEVALPGPVISVTEIKLDGVTLDESEYRVDNRRNLVRVGDGCWPTCQDMSLDADQPGTWEVTYHKGRPLPEAGKVALGAMASELFKACNGDKDCCLPERVTTIVRQGISMTLLDPMEFLTKGRTGIYAVDLWLAAVNPQGRPRHAGIYSPDVPLMRATTWPSP